MSARRRKVLRGNFQGTTARFWFGKSGKGGGTQGIGAIRLCPTGGLAGGGTQGVAAMLCPIRGLVVCPAVHRRVNAVERLAAMMLSETPGVESLPLPVYNEAFGMAINFLENVIDDMGIHDIDDHDVLMLFNLFCSHGTSSSNSSLVDGFDRSRASGSSRTWSCSANLVFAKLGYAFSFNEDSCNPNGA